MKIGYPCINTSIGCKSGRTFRLRSYSEERFIETVKNNLICLERILKFNVQHDILFFRITSDLIPFASHPICTFDWQNAFAEQFRRIGNQIQNFSMRISMHPDQFTIINSLENDVFLRSVRELAYHAQVQDLMELDNSAKIQIHIGGVYGNKNKSMRRFEKRYERLQNNLKRRLVIENDDRQYNLKDCLKISGTTGAPVLYDVFHHEVNCSGETQQESFALLTKTWKKNDGAPMIDYSSQNPGERIGKHVEEINVEHFKEFIEKSKPYDFDVMLEIKNKEKSALEAVKILRADGRFLTAKT